jgi:hypothetical protein
VTRRHDAAEVWAEGVQVAPRVRSSLVEQIQWPGYPIQAGKKPADLEVDRLLSRN